MRSNGEHIVEETVEPRRPEKNRIVIFGFFFYIVKCQYTWGVVFALLFISGSWELFLFTFVYIELIFVIYN
jgi:hypothetical protein